MNTAVQKVLDEIMLLSPEWHGSGTMSNIVLRAMAVHAEQLGEIHDSAETGSGKTTLLFSHLSRNHVAFAVNLGESISCVKNSKLFNPGPVTYVEGPSQLTLPRHVFKQKLQIALIDGPHGYPFPDLEYYYFYPQIAPGGLLLIDDINIPTIRKMFDVIKAEDMFELLEVVEHTAFFRRTLAPLIDPLSDSWWLQGFNQEHYQYAMARQHAAASKFQLFKRLVPTRLKGLIPIKWKTRLLKRL